MKKLIHTADWHLGAKLGVRSRLPEQQGFLKWLLDVLREERPDLLVVAGDVFDTGAPSNEAQSEYYRFIKAVDADGLAGHVLILGGNHDSPSLLAAPKPVLEAVRTVVVPEGARTLAEVADAEAFSFDCSDGGALAVAAVPFLRSAVLANNAQEAGVDAELPPAARAEAGFRIHCAKAVEAARAKAPEGSPLILTGHCVVTGATYSDDTSEVSRRVIGGVDGIGMDAIPDANYVALGHLHLSHCVGGRETVRYAGAPIPMSFAESNAEKGVTVVEFDEGNVAIRQRVYEDAQEFWRIMGSAEKVGSDLKALLEARPDSTAWIEATLTEGAGDPIAFRRNLMEIVRPYNVTLMMTKDERENSPRNAMAVAGGRNLDSLSPRELALKRLEVANLTKEQFDEYVAMIDAALAANPDEDVEEQTEEQ